MGVEPIKITLATSWSGWLVLPQLPPSSRLGRLLLTYTLNLEASPGISPGYEVLQTPTSILCHDAESVLWGD
jgi:hypothetical protein